MKKTPEFFKKNPRSRLDRTTDEEITKKTVLLGGLTLGLLVILVIFGLPLLIRLSVILGNNHRDDTANQEKLLPPLPPRLVTSLEATNSANFAISGVAEPQVEVELFKNDVTAGKTNTDEKGGFTFNDIVLEKGGNTFTAIAAKEKEGKSELSKAVTIMYDDKPPTLVMTNPSEDKLEVDYADFDIIGNSDPGVSVTVNGRVALVDDEGGFKLKYQLNSGKNSLEIVARNVAGNESRKTIEISYEI